MGGGRNSFLPNKLKYALNASYSETGNRIDERNLIQEWKDKGSTFIWTRNEFDKLKPNNKNDHILGIFLSELFKMRK
jgi:alkaline phosphatase